VLRIRSNFKCCDWQWYLRHWHNDYSALWQLLRHARTRATRSATRNCVRDWCCRNASLEQEAPEALKAFSYERCVRVRDHIVAPLTLCSSGSSRENRLQNVTSCKTSSLVKLRSLCFLKRTFLTIGSFTPHLGFTAEHEVRLCRINACQEVLVIERLPDLAKGIQICEPSRCGP